MPLKNRKVVQVDKNLWGDETISKEFQKDWPFRLQQMHPSQGPPNRGDLLQTYGD